MPDAVTSEWRDVIGFEGLYEVSSDGDVRRIGQAARTGRGRGGGATIGRILKTSPHRGGYLHVQLWKNGKPHTGLLHGLVAAAFLGPCPADHEVNHKNGNKRDCRAPNLEYVTRSENNRHAYATGLRTSPAGRQISTRQPRTTVPCACGCGETLETPDSKGRDRRFISGHNARRRT